MAIFKGAGVAIVTPMKDNEEVNYDKLEELINWQIDEGTDAIIIAGTTAYRSWQAPGRTARAQQSSSHRRRRKQAWTDCSL
jgi:heptaprenylglyceryl phosphate synthase